MCTNLTGTSWSRLLGLSENPVPGYPAAVILSSPLHLSGERRQGSDLLGVCTSSQLVQLRVWLWKRLLQEQVCLCVCVCVCECMPKFTSLYHLSSSKKNHEHYMYMFIRYCSWNGSSKTNHEHYMYIHVNKEFCVNGSN